MNKNLQDGSTGSSPSDAESGTYFANRYFCKSINLEASNHSVLSLSLSLSLSHDISSLTNNIVQNLLKLILKR
jgi:hypothetical protein